MKPGDSGEEDSLRTTLVRFFQSKTASVNVEYSMIAVLIAVSLFGIWETIGSSVGEGYAGIANAFISLETTGSIK